MRTTLTLDDDLAVKLQALAHERHTSFKEVVNEAIRSGLAADRASMPPYEVPSRPLGLLPGIDLDKALQLATDLEDDELIRKLELRK